MLGFPPDGDAMDRKETFACDEARGYSIQKIARPQPIQAVVSRFLEQFWLSLVIVPRSFDDLSRLVLARGRRIDLAWVGGRVGLIGRVLDDQEQRRARLLLSSEAPGGCLRHEPDCGSAAGLPSEPVCARPHRLLLCLMCVWWLRAAVNSRMATA